jgi:enamine deaminase RidA (YjgF/YER057c/UK114 family)
VGERVLVSGTAPIWPDGCCDPDPEVQARRCLEIILDALREVGADARHVVRTRTYLLDARVAREVPGLPERDLDAAPATVRGFIDPVLAGTASGRWTPHSLAWSV